MPGNPKSTPRRPRRRWRILRILAVGSTLLLVAIVTVGWVAYNRRVELANSFLKSSAFPFEATVGALELSGLSALTVDGVQLRIPGIETPFLTFSSSASNLSVNDLLDGHLADLRIADANVIIDDALLATLTTPDPPPEGDSQPAGSPSASLLISNLFLDNATVTVRLAGLPETTFRVDHHGEDIQIGGGLPVTGSQKLKISELQAVLEPGTAPVASASSLDLEFTSAGDAGGLNVGSLKIESPALNLTQPLIDRLLAPRTNTPATPDDPAPAPLPFPVSIESVHIDHLTLETPADLKLPEAFPLQPAAGSATVSIEGGRISIDPDGTFTSAPQKITASGNWGEILDLRSFSAELSSTGSTLFLTSLGADTHFDLPPAGDRPGATGDLRIDLADLALTPDGLQSSATQSLNLANFTASQGNSSAGVQSLVARLRPDSLLADKRIDSLLVSGVRLNLDPATILGPAEQDTSPQPAGTEPPFWHGLAITELAVAGGTIESNPAPELGIPGVSASFEVSTLAQTADNVSYRTEIGHVRLTSGSEALATVRSITAEADPASLWDRRRISRLTVDGVSLTLGQDFLDATTPRSARTTAAEQPAAATGDSAGWTLGEFVIDRSTVIIDGLVPGLPPLPLAISTTLTDIPLSSAGVAAAAKQQSVTVSNARLRSRLNPLLDVARFGDVTLHFTFRDLARQKIDLISIDNPVIFVGEHLFWYVDYFRKFESPAATAEDGPAQPGWDVTTVEANGGELVLAPKGAPLTELPKLPFSGKTSIVDSQLSFDLDSSEDPGTEVSEKRPLLSLTVPRGDYPLKSLNLGLEVDLKGLRGDIAFNLPIQQRTNNLVQTLYADELWFKNIGAEEVYLAVTYDQQGIYAKFGGKAYGGYAEGAFNLYNDDAYSWDGWVAGTTIELSPLTSALTPEYLEMTGVADAKFIAQGNFESFDDITANGSIKTAEGGGKIDILALGDLGESLVEDAEPIAAALTTAGIDVIRYFDYDTAEIGLEMFGREGDVNLDLRGPSGLRQINITAHDYRNQTTAP